MALLQKSKITPDFRWNPALRGGRYIGPNGRIVSPLRVREVIDDYIEKQADVARNLAAQLSNREITIAEWQKAMHKVVANTINANIAAEKGGWAQMDAKARGTAAQLIKQQLGGLKKWESRGLRGFAEDLESGKQKMDGSFINRALMYVNSGRVSYESVRRDDMKERGMTEEKNIRHVTDSCKGCLEATTAGWQPIGTLPMIGDRDCVMNDKCSFDYR